MTRTIPDPAVHGAPPTSGRPVVVVRRYPLLVATAAGGWARWSWRSPVHRERPDGSVRCGRWPSRCARRCGWSATCVRVDVLAVTATALVGEYVAALVVVLMLTGGQALEDYDLVTTLNALRALRPGRARAD